MNKERIVKIIRKILIILIIFWMIGVFIFSNQNGNSSSGLSSKVAIFIFKDESVASNMEPVIRKLAHMSEYAVGAILFLGFCMTYPKMEPKKRILFSELCIILYAATDEIHQLFISGRHRQHSRCINRCSRRTYWYINFMDYHKINFNNGIQSTRRFRTFRQKILN